MEHTTHESVGGDEREDCRARTLTSISHHIVHTIRSSTRTRVLHSFGTPRLSYSCTTLTASSPRLASAKRLLPWSQSTLPSMTNCTHDLDSHAHCNAQRLQRLQRLSQAPSALQNCFSGHDHGMQPMQKQLLAGLLHSRRDQFAWHKAIS